MSPGLEAMEARPHTGSHAHALQDKAGAQDRRCFQAQVKRMKVEEPLRVAGRSWVCTALLLSMRLFRQAFRTSVWSSEEST